MATIMTIENEQGERRRIYSCDALELLRGDNTRGWKVVAASAKRGKAPLPELESRPEHEAATALPGGPSRISSEDPRAAALTPAGEPAPGPAPEPFNLAQNEAAKVAFAQAAAEKARADKAAKADPLLD